MSHPYRRAFAAARKKILGQRMSDLLWWNSHGTDSPWEGGPAVRKEKRIRSHKIFASAA